METPQDALQQRFLEAVGRLKFRFPVAKISKETGYKSPIISEYLSSKKTVSEKFLQKFCEVYGFDYTDMINAGDNNTQFTLSDFLYQYRMGVSKVGGGKLGTRELATMLGADILSDNVVKWEMRGTIPRDESHRKAIRAFFGIEDLDSPAKDELERAIASYPNAVKKIINKDKNHSQADNNEGNHLNLPPHKTGDDMINQLMDLMKQQNTIAEKTASALDKFGDAYKSMAKSMELMIGEKHEGREPLKKTGS